MSRTVIHALLAVILLTASPLRALCYDSCVANAGVVQPSDNDTPACHETHDTEPTSPSDPSDDGCRHRDESPALSLRTAHKPVDMSTDAQASVHVVPDRMHDTASMTSRRDTLDRLLHRAPAPPRFPLPLRI